MAADAGSTYADSQQRLRAVREVARQLHLSERQIRRMIADGRITVVRLGRAVRIRPETVAALVEGK